MLRLVVIYVCSVKIINIQCYPHATFIRDCVMVVFCDNNPNTNFNGI